MKKYKRIEITAFRRRVAITFGESPTSSTTEHGVNLNDLDSAETIEIESEIGQAVLAEAVRILESTLSSNRAPTLLAGNTTDGQ